MFDCEELSVLEKGIPLETLQETVKERLANRVTDVEFRILRRITETQFHTEDLYDCKIEEYKYNRYSDILPCRFGRKHRQADESGD